MSASNVAASVANAPSAAVRTLADLEPGAQAEVRFTVSPNDMAAFASLSGDHNPLHTDLAFAQTKGFAGVVVYGALLVAKTSQLVGMQLPGRDSVWVSVHYEFRKPLYVGVPAVLEATVSERSESTGLLTLQLTVRADGKLIAKGQAEVLLAH